MKKVYSQLYVGDETDCRTGGSGWSVVHACKHPCHKSAVGYTGSLDPSNPQYLSVKDGRDLYLNMIDPERPLFQQEMFEDFFSFTVSQWQDGNEELLIHCNQGRSRSPSLALLLLASYTNTVPGESFAAARQQFKELYPRYRPSRGIALYLEKHWSDLLDLSRRA